MKFTIGDHVRFLNEVGGGEIVAQVNGNTVLVRDEDGFEVPTLISELVPDMRHKSRVTQGEKRESKEPIIIAEFSSPSHTEETRIDAKAIETLSPAPVTTTTIKRPKPAARPVKSEPEEIEVLPSPNSLDSPVRKPRPRPRPATVFGQSVIAKRSVHLENSDPKDFSRCDAHILLKPNEVSNLSYYVAVSRNEMDSNLLDLYVINDSYWNLFVTISVDAHTDSQTIFSGEVRPNSASVKYSSLQLDRQNEWLLRFQSLLFSEKKEELRSPVETEIFLSCERLVRPGAFQRTRFIDAPLFLCTMREQKRDSESNRIDVTAYSKTQNPILVSTKSDPKPSENAPPKEEEVLDIRIENIPHHGAVLPTEERQKFLLNMIREAIAKALEQDITKRVVAMFGVNNTQLRSEITRMMRTEFPSLPVQDASFKEYAYGATMIIINREKA